VSVQEDNESDSFFREYHKDLCQIDEAAQIVLRAHFQVEAALDKYLSAIFRHPEYLRRLSFFSRLQIARAYTPVSHNEPEWRVIETLNVMRNVIVHGGSGEDRTAKLGELYKALTAINRGTIRKIVESTTNYTEIVTHGALVGGGFLLVLEEELLRAQGRWNEEEDD
jgi:hypothetical protein